MCCCAAVPAVPPAAVYFFAEKFMLWSAFQALVMLVQNRYQKRRMYTRIAMGKNSAMDVVSGESSGSTGQLMVLYPMLFREYLLGAGRTDNCSHSLAPSVAYEALAVLGGHS